MQMGQQDDSADVYAVIFALLAIKDPFALLIILKFPILLHNKIFPVDGTIPDLQRKLDFSHDQMPR